MEKRRVIVTALVLVAAIAIAIFLTKDYWISFVYYNYVLPHGGPTLPSGWGSKSIMPKYAGSYLEKFFTAQTPSSEYPEYLLADRNLLDGYSRFYYRYQLTENVSIEGPNNSTVLKIYVFKYESQTIAKTLYEKSNLENIELLGGARVKHGPNKYVFQSNAFIVYIESTEGFEYMAKDAMERLLLAYLGE